MHKRTGKEHETNGSMRSVVAFLMFVILAYPAVCQGEVGDPVGASRPTAVAVPGAPNKTKGHADPTLIERVFRYGEQVEATFQLQDTSYAYTKFYLRVDRKNPTLMLVPSVYAIAHRAEREFVGESYNKFYQDRDHHYESENLINLTTIPHKRRAFDVMLKYLTPNIYQETIIDNTIISPFHAANNRFYHYKTSPMANGQTLLAFTPKRKNTQLVIGTAIVDTEGGRILSCDLTGEYDMINFQMHLDMGKSHGAMRKDRCDALGRDNGVSPIPSRCEVSFKFSFLRSKVTGRYVARYGLSRPCVSSPTLSDYDKLCQVRPEPLSRDEQTSYDKALVQESYDKALEQHPATDSLKADSTVYRKKRNFAKDVLWDAVGDNMFNRVKTHFGVNNQGYIRLNPVLNPLYMGYDHHRGFTYKVDLRASYQLSHNAELSARLKAGYAFKQHQFFFRLPVYYYFNKQRNGYFKLEWNNGNHIRNASVRRRIEHEQPDSTLYDYSRLNEFKQMEMRAIFNYDLSDKWSIQLGTLFQRKMAVHKRDFDQFGWKKEYRSFAPVAEVQYRPMGWSGPVITLDYDRGVKGIAKANTGYERWELNADYIHHVNKLQSWQMRIGTGFYTMKNRDAYFLNYENFKENNLPNGWNDDWSGDFELLRGDTYNTSEYYVRANVTYESPLLLLSWLPWIGHYVEMERVYISTLDVHDVHPYVEAGYGFTCRLMSMGLFFSNGRGNRTFGVTFGFGLFRNW